MTVPFADLRALTALDRNEIDAAMARVLDRGWFVLGEEGASFEREFGAWLGGIDAAGVGSGTDAIELALRALGVGAGDEVITQANTCVPTVSAIVRTGATPVLCDVEPGAGTMDPGSAARAVTSRTRAIVPVHLYGQCADVDAIRAAAGPVAIVEDCAQAHGAELRRRRAGTMGDASAFSFYPTKNLPALGDGGAVAAPDEELVATVRRLRMYGQVDRYHHAEYGVNSRLDEVQAAVLRGRLGRLDAANARRRQIADRYDAALADAALRPLARLEERVHAFHLYVVRTDDRDRAAEALAARGVSTLVHYPLAIHQQPAFRELGTGAVPLNVSEEMARTVLSLPLHPALSDAEVDVVTEAVAAL